MSSDIIIIIVFQIRHHLRVLFRAPTAALTTDDERREFHHRAPRGGVFDATDKKTTTILKQQRRRRRRRDAREFFGTAPTRYRHTERMGHKHRHRRRYAKIEQKEEEHIFFDATTVFLFCYATRLQNIRASNVQIALFRSPCIRVFFFLFQTERAKKMKGVDPATGNTWFRESGIDRGDGGYRCRWTVKGGAAPDKSWEYREARRRKPTRAVRARRGKERV